jgi:hypothetical protein
VAERPMNTRQLQLALEVVAYELGRRPGDYAATDPIAALERVRDAANALPANGALLRESYPALVELATAALTALGSMPEPDEVDGLLDFGGFELWRAQR